MTVLEASGELFNWFDKNDKFDLEKGHVFAASIIKVSQSNDIVNVSILLTLICDFKTDNNVESIPPDKKTPKLTSEIDCLSIDFFRQFSVIDFA